MKSIKEEVDQLINTPGFTMRHCGASYKFGTHGFVYRWSDNSKEWVKSEVDPETLRHPLTTKIIRERAKHEAD
jgi:hypothetical protein